MDQKQGFPVVSSMISINRKIFRKFYFWFGAIVIVILIVSAIFSVLTPKPLPKETVVSSNLSFTPEITLQEITVEIPQSVSIYQAVKQEDDLTSLVNKVTAVFRLQAHEELEEYWVSENGSVLVQKDNDRNTVVYLNQSALPKENDLIEEVTKDVLLEKTRMFIEQLDIYPLFSVREETPIVFSSYDIEETSENRANGFLYVGEILLDGIPVITGNKSTPTAMVWMRKDGVIVKSELRPQRLVFNQLEAVDALQISALTSNIKNGDFIYIDAESEDVLIGQPKELAKIELSAHHIQYRVNEENGYTLPYLHLTGIGVDRSGHTYKIQVVTPIVKTQ